MYKFSSFKDSEIKSLSEQNTTCMLLQRMKGIEEHKLIKLINKLPQDFFTQIVCWLFIVEKNNPTVNIIFLWPHFSHEKLKIIDV